MHQAKGEYSATDVERGMAESLGLLMMAGAEAGMVRAFTDGQGMPGTKKWVDQANAEYVSTLLIGVGAGCEATKQFGENGLHASGIAQLIQKLSSSEANAAKKAGWIG